MKICSKCGKEKTLSEFSNQKTGKGGKRASCIKCDTKATYAHRKKYNIHLSKGTKEHQYSVSLKYLYGITLEDYTRIFTEQNGCCKICDRHQLQFKRRLSVDHCHKTGKVRGLLCSNCNHGLGKFMDNKELLLRAVKYLE